MDPSSEIAILEKPELSIQKLDDGPSCSAHAAINTLYFTGVNLSPHERTELIEFTQNVKHLETADKTELFNKHGLEYHSLSTELLEVPRKPDAIFDKINEVLEKSPIGLSISTYLSRRPEEYRLNKSTMHVVTARKVDDTIQIIDPYQPDNPEEFNIQDDSEKTRFLAWFMSPRAQQIAIAEGREKNANSVIDIATNRLTSEDRQTQFFFIGESLSLATAYYGEKMNNV